MTTWTIALACGAGFVATHHVLSHAPLRRRLVDALGAYPFMGLYSVVSSVLYLPLAWLWWTNTQATPVWWSLRDPVSVGVSSLLATAGLVLLVGGAVQSSRASVSTVMSGRDVHTPVGMQGFTRHPVLMGFALFSIAHLWVDGGAVDVAFHGTNLAVAVIGAPHLDSRYRQADPGYAAWMDRTRLVPLPWPVEGTRWPTMSWVGVAAGLGLAAAAWMWLHG